MAGVASDKHTRNIRARQRRILPRHLLELDVVELVAQALADFVHRPPGHLLYIQSKGMKDALGSADDLVNADVAGCNALIHREFVEFHINAHEIPALARDEHDAAFIGGLDQRLETDVGKVGDHQHVHHAPGMVGRIALQRAANGLAHATSRTIAAHDVTGAEGLHLAQVPFILPLEPDRDGVGGGALRRWC